MSGHVAGVVTQVARERGFDPLLGLAVGHVESGLDPAAIGDRSTPYASYGVFQERLVVGRGGFTVPDTDPRRQAERFYADVDAYLRAGGGGTPGEVAAAVQRPFDRVGYAAKVDAAYRRLAGASSPAPSSQLAAAGAPISLPSPPGIVQDLAGGALEKIGPTVVVWLLVVLAVILVAGAVL